MGIWNSHRLFAINCPEMRIGMKKRLFVAMSVIIVCMTILTGCGKKAEDYNNTGIQLYNSSEFDKAQEEFKQAIKLQPDNAEYYLNLGKAQLEVRAYDDALSSFQEAVAKGSEDLEVYRGLGIIYYFTNNYALALENFTKVINESGTLDEMVLEVYEYYASLQTYYGDYAGALDSYDILIRKKHNLAQQYFLRGSIYTQQGMENEAVLDYEETLKLYSQEKAENYEIYYNIYYNFYTAGFEERAESYLKRALSIDGADNLLKGKTYYIIGDYENAQKYLSKAVDEGHSDGEFYLAMAYEMLGNYSEAESMYVDYIKKYPSDSRAYNQFGMYYMNKKDYETALTYFVGGLSCSDIQAKKELMFNEACCYEYLNDYKTAFDKFGKYLEEYPDDEKAIHEYEFLKTR